MTLELTLILRERGDCDILPLPMHAVSGGEGSWPAGANTELMANWGLEGSAYA